MVSILYSGRNVGRTWLFNKQLDHVFGFHDSDLLIAEYKFRIMFSPERNRINLIAFAFINGYVVI